MAQTQMALDSLDFDGTVALATKVAPHVDILEIGTPCIKHNGIKLLEVLRAKFPNNKILVDLKTMDAGFYEAEPVSYTHLMMNIRKLSTKDAGFDADLKALLAFETAQDDSIDVVVANILKDVKARGDEAVLEYTNRFDKTSATKLSELEISQAELVAALNGLPTAQREALQSAAARVRSYHEKQLMQSWSYTEADGTLLGQQVTSLDRVGLYVPGGKAAYPSSVLMNAIPAKVAGVQELIMVVPTPNGEKNALVLAAAAVCGVDRVFCIGGAQAVGALAYGTQTVPQVDKIVGPGNAYVAAAKRRVFGVVGIDMVAGPSEILVICDGKTNPCLLYTSRCV